MHTSQHPCDRLAGISGYRPLADLRAKVLQNPRYGSEHMDTADDILGGHAAYRLNENIVRGFDEAFTAGSFIIRRLRFLETRLLRSRRRETYWRSEIYDLIE